MIVTDALCKDYFEPMGLEVEYVPFDADASFYQDLLLKRDPVGLISIERCGINSKNDYANMRGVSIRENTATIDQLFSLAHKKVFRPGVSVTVEMRLVWVISKM